MKLGLFSSGWLLHDSIQLGASDFWRLAVPGRELFRNGWDVTLARQINARGDGTLVLLDEAGNWHDDCEIILMQRWMGEKMPAAIRRARAVGQVIVNDVDDYFWDIPRSNVARQHTDPTRHPAYNRDIYRATIKASDAVTVSTPFLARALERWGPPVHLIRNYIALDRWSAKPPGERIGWVGAIPWRGADLQILAPTVVPWLRERGEPFYHGGHLENGRSARELLRYENVVTLSATDLPRYPQLWDPLGVALVPLENSTFNQAKSFVKGLEACARGVPFIASNHSEYRWLGAGRIVRRPREWVEHLDVLRDPAVRIAEGAANRERAEELSIERNWTEWDVVLRDVARVPTAA